MIGSILTMMTDLRNREAYQRNGAIAGIGCWNLNQVANWLDLLTQIGPTSIEAIS